MYKFPRHLYTDVRIENVFETNITYTLGNLDNMMEKTYKAAFIRLYDGNMWYYSSTTDVDNIQKEIDKLAALTKPNPNIYADKIYQKFEVHKGNFTKFNNEDSCNSISKDVKNELLTKYYSLISSNEYVKFWRATYIDQKVVKNFYSSKGSEIVTDFQRCGFRVTFRLVDGDKKFEEGFDKGANYFEDLFNLEDKVLDRFNESINFLKNSVNIVPGQYKVILSPLAAGVFAHESFGHKSEADFMVTDDTMKKEWEIGKQVGAEMLSIVETGNVMGSGFIQYDDEGTKAKTNYLIKNGKLAGRLHSAVTAAILDEEVTGNARAKDFEYEPIVRMTTTYIDKGDKTLEQLISEVDEGIIVKTIKHGSGMSTFTIAPSLAYMIRNGKIAEPVKISVLTGNVFETLNLIDGLSDKVELLSFVLGGCGKMEQFPLPVGFGGPYVRVKSLNVQ